MRHSQSCLTSGQVVAYYDGPSGEGGDIPAGLQKVWNKIPIDSEFNDLSLHVLRHLFASSVVSSGETLYIVGKLFGHALAKTAQTYVNLALCPIRAAADEVSADLGRKIAKRAE